MLASGVIWVRSRRSAGAFPAWSLPELEDLTLDFAHPSGVRPLETPEGDPFVWSYTSRGVGQLLLRSHVKSELPPALSSEPQPVIAKLARSGTSRIKVCGIFMINSPNHQPRPLLKFAEGEVPPLWPDTALFTC